jgi:hypothetical protein
MYIDPNTGGLLFQVLIVLFGVFSGTVLIFSSKIKMGIAKLRRKYRERSGEELPGEIDSPESDNS